MNLSSLPPAIQSFAVRLFDIVPLRLPGGVQFSYIQAGLIVILLFLLIYTLGHLRHTYLDWSIKGIMPGLTFGFIIAIIIEGLLLIGGKTILTETLGWKNAPKPISNVLDAGRTSLTEVLGVSSTIPNSNAKSAPTLQSIKSDIETLNPTELTSLKSSICKP